MTNPWIPFQAVLKNRSSLFLQDRRPDLDAIIRGNRNQEAVEGGMMKFAQREAIGDLRLPFLAIRHDVGRVQQ
jgi:hypothetical protein